MLLLVTGASGAGKSTARELIAPELAPDVECSELVPLAPQGMPWTMEWRQRGAQAAVRRAVELQAGGRHLLLAGDPVAAVEIAAAPSAPELDGFAACLLDLQAGVQTGRLKQRGEPAELIPHHVNFAAWMRQQVANPLHMLEVVKEDGWSEMRWDRIPGLAPKWHMHVIDTTDLSRAQVADKVLKWCRAALLAQTPTLSVPVQLCQGGDE